MSPMVWTFIIGALLLGYIAGRTHGALAYRIGFRFGYRQGYFDGDRGGRIREERRAAKQIGNARAALQPLTDASLDVDAVFNIIGPPPEDSQQGVSEAPLSPVGVA